MTSSFNFQSARFRLGQNFNGDNTGDECRLEFFSKVNRRVSSSS